MLPRTVQWSISTRRITVASVPRDRAPMPRANVHPVTRTSVTGGLGGCWARPS